MSENSAVEVAKKQRYLALLKKVRENKPLTAAELEELEKYEMARKPENNGPKTKDLRLKTKKRKGKTLLSEADCIRLGRDYDDIAAADAASGIEPNLHSYLSKHPRLRAAYDRGRLLRALARTAPSSLIYEAARRLKDLGFSQFTSGQDLRKFLDGDLEANEVWESARVNATIENRENLRAASKDGNVKAIELLDKWTVDRTKETGEGTAASFNKVTTNQMAELFGVSRQTIYEWNQKGLSQNIDGTYDLYFAIKWIQEFTVQKVTTKSGPVNLNPKEAVKTELLKYELQEKQGQMISRTTYIATMISIFQNLVNSFNSITDLANRVFGQPREEIVNMLEEFRDEICAKLQKPSAELKLSPQAEQKLIELYELISDKSDMSDRSE